MVRPPSGAGRAAGVRDASGHDVEARPRVAHFLPSRPETIVKTALRPVGHRHPTLLNAVRRCRYQPRPAPRPIAGLGKRRTTHPDVGYEQVDGYVNRNGLGGIALPFDPTVVNGPATLTVRSYDTIGNLAEHTRTVSLVNAVRHYGQRASSEEVSSGAKTLPPQA
ncbi:hypothetical protein Q0Z83_104640 [Actinoplanes sichuanensis]|uniref:Uncharacterized protein n=1 Tax=Actinoplanes sichuanensis TaxID=512349 RepID=A0ABW4AHY7_9ACTN|nr:hypothetical protein [Actinoplanes sichuanensis]BEL12273.1 hypothetical protein Q0Z83_104640 [Actinoplanes sichuanensis]